MVCYVRFNLMIVEQQIKMTDEDYEKYWPKLKNKKLTIWALDLPNFVYIKIDNKKDYHAWDIDWFIHEL